MASDGEGVRPHSSAAAHTLTKLCIHTVKLHLDLLRSQTVQLPLKLCIQSIR